MGHNFWANLISKWPNHASFPRYKLITYKSRWKLWKAQEWQNLTLFEEQCLSKSKTLISPPPLRVFFCATSRTVRIGRREIVHHHGGCSQAPSLQASYILTSFLDETSIGAPLFHPRIIRRSIVAYGNASTSYNSKEKVIRVWSGPSNLKTG